MGLSIAGLAFKPTAATPDEPAMIRLAFGSGYDALAPNEAQHSYDIRLPGNVAVESTHGATFIYDGDIAQRILFEEEAPGAQLLAALGHPELLVVFCHYDSGDTFGYRIFENGVAPRLRLYSGGATHDTGAPRAFELSWLNAEPVVAEDDEPPAYRHRETGETIMEGHVTARLLGAAMQDLFGTCPWGEGAGGSALKAYRLKPATTEVQPTSGKAWWKFW